jgi:2-polyprenyl-3-methyl-5-hydroxy-6-metoxy-1,4-benzoquinol methylase
VLDLIDAREVWNKLYRDGLFTEFLPEREVIEFSSLLRRRRLRRVLDLGCGAGRHLVLLAKMGFEVYGVDISIAAIMKASERLNRLGLNAELCLGDMRSPAILMISSMR